MLCDNPLNGAAKLRHGQAYGAKRLWHAHRPEYKPEANTDLGSRPNLSAPAVKHARSHTVLGPYPFRAPPLSEARTLDCWTLRNVQQSRVRIHASVT